MTKWALSTSWLREQTLGAQAQKCLDVWTNGGYKDDGMKLAVTEAAIMSGGEIEGTPTVKDFMHSFFSIAQLGQFAMMGVDMVGRWSINGHILETVKDKVSSWR